MTRPHVLDFTALLALFEAHHDLMALMKQAERDEIALITPASAIAEANLILGASLNGWSALLWPGVIDVMGLDMSTAIALPRLGDRFNHLASRHAVWETRAVAGVLVTRSPNLYPPDMVPILTI